MATPIPGVYHNYKDAKLHVRYLVRILEEIFLEKTAYFAYCRAAYTQDKRMVLHQRCISRCQHPARARKRGASVPERARPPRGGIRRKTPMFSPVSQRRHARPARAETGGLARIRAARVCAVTIQRRPRFKRDFFPYGGRSRARTRRGCASKKRTASERAGRRRIILRQIVTTALRPLARRRRTSPSPTARTAPLRCAPC